MGNFDIRGDELWSYKSTSRSKKVGEDVTVPDGITTIGAYAFSDDHNWNLNHVILPEGVTTIKKQAFVECGLTALHIPSTLQSVEKKVFARCKNLKYIYVSGNCFNWLNGDQEIPQSVTIIQNTDTGMKIWACSMKNKACNIPHNGTAEAWADYDREIIENGPQFKFTMPTRLLGAIGRFMDPVELTEENREMFSALLVKNMKHLIQAVEELKMPQLIQILFDEGVITGSNWTAIQKLLAASKVKEISAFAKTKVETKTSAPKKAVKQKAAVSNLGEEFAAGLTQKEWGEKLKSYYAVDLKDIPEILDADGKELSASVKAWLFTVHECMENMRNGELIVSAKYEKAGLCPEAAEIVSKLDQNSLQSTLLKLANATQGIKAKNKKMYFAYPICRYADEVLMEELTRRAPEWCSQVSGMNAPPLLTFRQANAYSETRAAMRFADKYNDTSYQPDYLDMDTYAKIRGTDADTIRDKYLSDVGLDSQGGKAYDLGSQTVTVRLQKDLSFLVEVPGAKKPSKSIPKKNANAEKYAAANADFTELKKNANKIIKRRNAALLEDFLSGRERSGADWKAAYLPNPLLRMTARLLVWSQDGQTFTLTETDAITADGTIIQIRDDAPVILAHPMEMSQSDLLAWQKYFTANGLKQPFEQIWEPVMDMNAVTEDRYAGCMIPYKRLAGQGKHGVHVEDSNFHSDIYINFDDCDTKVVRIDNLRHQIEPDHRFEIQKFVVGEHNRKTNHIVAYLDRVTIFERIRKDDVSVAALLPRFTLAQITEFIKIAAENNCPNVQAILLDYKNRNFADFDPMEEFSLDL